MDLTKYKNKSRILLIKSPNYKLKDYLNIKYVYQKHIKKFHKRHVKLITKIDKKGFKIKFIDFDGKTKKILNKINTNTLFRYIDTLKISKTTKPINLSLFSDYNPKTTTHGLGFKNKEKALFTISAIKNRPIKYQVNVVSTMLGRAKNHPNKTKDMGVAIKVFAEWMRKYKSKKK
jgi:hypothetical protein